MVLNRQAAYLPRRVPQKVRLPLLLGYVVDFEDLGWKNSKFVVCPGIKSGYVLEAGMLAAAFSSPETNFVVLDTVHSPLVGRERTLATGYVQLKPAASGSRCYCAFRAGYHAC